MSKVVLYVEAPDGVGWEVPEEFEIVPRVGDEVVTRQLAEFEVAYATVAEVSLRGKTAVGPSSAAVWVRADLDTEMSGSPIPERRLDA